MASHKTKLKTAEKIIRITVVGDGDTGKTCLLIVYKDKKFDDRYTPTIFDEYSMTIPINHEPYTIILSDTAGQEEFDKLRKLAYRFADTFILCYSIAERASFENISGLWAPELKRCRSKASIILVATKIDLLSQRKVSTEEGEAMAKEIGAAGFIETSSKTNGILTRHFKWLSGQSYPAEEKSANPNLSAIYYDILLDLYIYPFILLFFYVAVILVY